MESFLFLPSIDSGDIDIGGLTGIDVYKIEIFCFCLLQTNPLVRLVQFPTNLKVGDTAN